MTDDQVIATLHEAKSALEQGTAPEIESMIEKLIELETWAAKKRRWLLAAAAAEARLRLQYRDRMQSKPRGQA